MFVITPFALSIGAAILCGIGMIFCSLYFLAIGAIRLRDANPSDAVSLEFRNLILRTRNPTIALFLIGLAFIVLAIFFSQPTIGSQVPIVGTIEMPELALPADTQLNAEARSVWTLFVDTDRTLQGSVQSVPPHIQVYVYAPGAQGTKTISTEALESGKLNVGSIRLVRTTSRPEPIIQPVPPNVPLPPPNQIRGF